MGEHRGSKAQELVRGWARAPLG